MKYLLWSVIIASMLTVITVFAEADDEDLPARVAPKSTNSLPSPSNGRGPNPYKENMEAIPASLSGASIEVGFSQEGEPEPHMFAAVDDTKVRVYHTEHSRSPASVSSLENKPSTLMSVEVFAKRIHRVVDDDRFFSAKQPNAKPHCKDKYYLKITMSGKTRVRSGCANQNNDPFAQFAQVFFKDSFLAWQNTK